MGELLEVVTTWGDELLDVAHVRVGRVDDALGEPLVVTHRGRARLCVPAGARCVLRRTAPRARGIERIREVLAIGLPSDVVGPAELDVPEDATAVIVRGALAHAVSRVAGTDDDTPRAWAHGATSFMAALGASSATHAVAVTLALMQPTSDVVDVTSLTALPRLDVVARVLAPEKPLPLPPPPHKREGEGSGGGAAPTGDAEGGGTPREHDLRTTSRAPRVPHDAPPAAAPHDVGIDAVRAAGILGVLPTFSIDGPGSPFTRDTAGTTGDAPGLEAFAALRDDAFGMAGRAGASCDASCMAARLAPGIGEGRFGVFGGRLHGAHYGDVAPPLPPRAPRVIPHVIACCLTPHCYGGGRLWSSAIRRVIQRHIGEIRYCYEQGLVERADLEGRVTASFVIGGDGNVLAAAISSSDLGAPRVDACIVDAVKRWQFPASPYGDVTQVNYPFTLQTP